MSFCAGRFLPPKNTWIKKMHSFPLSRFWYSSTTTVQPAIGRDVFQKCSLSKRVPSREEQEKWLLNHRRCLNLDLQHHQFLRQDSKTQRVQRVLFLWLQEVEEEDFWAPSIQPKRAGWQFSWRNVLASQVICKRADSDGFWTATPQLKAVSMGAALAGQIVVCFIWFGGIQFLPDFPVTGVGAAIAQLAMGDKDAIQDSFVKCEMLAMRFLFLFFRALRSSWPRLSPLQGACTPCWWSTLCCSCCSGGQQCFAIPFAGPRRRGKESFSCCGFKTCWTFWER